jgi:hypothetical protein
VRAQRLRDLDGERAHAPGRTDHQDPLPRPHPPLVADGTKGGGPRHRNRRRLREGEAGRLRDQLVRAGDRELGERALGRPHHLVAHPDVRDVRADRLHGSRDVPPPDADLRSTEPDHEPRHVRHPGRQVPDVRATAGGVDTDEHVVLADGRFLGVLELEDVRRAVRVLCDRLHRDAPSAVTILDLAWCTPYTVEAHARCTPYTCQPG